MLSRHYITRKIWKSFKQ